MPILLALTGEGWKYDSYIVVLVCERQPPEARKCGFHWLGEVGQYERCHGLFAMAGQPVKWHLQEDEKENGGG